MSEHHPDDTPTGSGPLPDPEGYDELSPTARSLRDALAARAASMQPADRLEEIRMRTTSRHRSTRAWQAVAAVAAVAVIGGGAYAVIRGAEGGKVTTVAASSSTGTSATTTSRNTTSEAPDVAPAPSSAASSSPAASAPSATASPTGSGQATATGTATGPALSTGDATVPVYWIDSTRLFREFVATAAKGNDATNALQILLGGDPNDPDYRTPWRSDPGANVSLDGDGNYVVSVSASAASASLSQAEAKLAVQQLVYTVSAAAGDSAPVRLLVDGTAGARIFGSYTVPSTVSRAPQADVQAPAWITSVTPSAGSLTVEGVGTGFEGTLLYTLTDASGAEVARDSVSAGANGTYADFSFTADVPAGTYTLAVFAPDESDGEGGATVPDTKVVTVP